MSRKAFFVLWILLCAQSVWCVKILEFQIPRNVEEGDTVMLTCKYDLQGDTLYSVKWYKDEIEFYRFVPSANPQKKSFPLTSVYVDLQDSDDVTVTLEGVYERTSGDIRCEVATGPPHYKTVSDTKYLWVKDSSIRSSSHRIYGLLTFAVLLGMFALRYSTFIVAK